ncbi:hypothetical protein GGD81_004422 [Rhodobium orientis]|uniref:Uncharacterized protein n=1 Tax=Rhodobium orientis TaxID=34017 RepID=A0A327JGN0_9HYPH|nr:hypothetical protein [Rhodobium orientis]MBB4305347.1 hypothetical protein [Rhodobium orientis]MBK5949942.1 hypothetical protein [Rhodobium orientis]RAI25557.1 hypothetical protein CH339_17740 [Rhodobium orientis]
MTKDPLVAYKTFLSAAVEKRPSGTRRKLAMAFGTHPSFISQITNPALKVPLPAQHIPTLFQVCHFTPEEQDAFLDLYKRAHPAQAASIEELAENEKNVVKILLPQFDDPAVKADVIQAIRDFAENVIRLADGIAKRK